VATFYEGTLGDSSSIGQGGRTYHPATEYVTSVDGIVQLQSFFDVDAGGHQWAIESLVQYDRSANRVVASSVYWRKPVRVPLFDLPTGIGQADHLAPASVFDEIVDAMVADCDAMMDVVVGLLLARSTFG
jgi:hypothetical protein